MKQSMQSWGWALLAGALWGSRIDAQVDAKAARQYVEEARQLWQTEGAKTWGVSLEGPMVFFDAASQTIFTSQPEPEESRPALLGYANAIAKWGGEYWSTYVWQHLPKGDPQARARLMIHELTHRVQPELGFFVSALPCSHLDALEGRYFLQLEWRALSKALGSQGAESRAALADAMGFRWVRLELYPGAQESERCDVIREGLAQYTGVVVVHPKAEDAVREVQRQLAEYAQRASFVADFAYPTGAAYGVLLDRLAPGWTRSFQPEMDLAERLLQAADLEPYAEVELSAERYGGSDLMLREERREERYLQRVAEFSKRFIDGPVLHLPKGKSMSFNTSGKTAIPGAGTMFPNLRTTSPWGKLEAAWALVPDNQTKITLSAPTQIEGAELKGEDWTLTLEEGWQLTPGPRQGDYTLVHP